MEDTELKVVVSQMQACREQWRSETTEEDWNETMKRPKSEISLLMAVFNCTAIEAADKLVTLIELNPHPAFDTDKREVMKAIYVIAAIEMMEPDFLESLTQ